MRRNTTEVITRACINAEADYYYYYCSFQSAVNPPQLIPITLPKLPLIEIELMSRAYFFHVL